MRRLEPWVSILPGMTLVLREADVSQVVDMDAVIGAVETAMRELGEGVAQNVPRRRAFAPGGLLNVMFATYPGGRCTGVKAYSVAPGGARFLVSIFGLDGRLQALVEAEHMGAYRTGAASAVAVKALRPRAPVDVAIIGTGMQAMTQVLALSRVCEIKTLRVFGRDAQRRTAFARDRLAERARTVVVDQLATAQLESGDLIRAEAAGKFDWERAIELGSVLAGTWRAPDEPGITLFESHGLAIWDLAAASVVIPAARERGLGLEVPFFV